MKNLLLLVLLCLLFPFTAFAQGINKVSTIKGNKFANAIAIDKNNVLHLVYNNGTKRKNAQIVYQQSIDNGLTYSKEIVISSEDTESVAPDITTDTNGNIYVVWSTIAGSSSAKERRVLLSKSIDQGKTFSPAVIVFRSTQVEKIVFSDVPTVIVDKNNTIFVTISNGSAIESEKGIYITSSKDQGNTFSTATLISNIGEGTSKASIVIDSQNNLYVFYDGDRSIAQAIPIVFMTSSNDGINFNQPQSLAQITNFSFSGPKATIDESDTIYLSFGTGNNINFIKTMDRGKTFNTPVTVANSAGKEIAIVVDKQGKINIAWEEGTDLRERIELFFSNSTNGGVSFEPKSKLSTNANVSFGVSAAGNNNGDAFFSWISVVNNKNFRTAIFTKNVNQ